VLAHENSCHHYVKAENILSGSYPDSKIALDQKKKLFSKTIFKSKLS